MSNETLNDRLEALWKGLNKVPQLLESMKELKILNSESPISLDFEKIHHESGISEKFSVIVARLYHQLLGIKVENEGLVLNEKQDTALFCVIYFAFVEPQEQEPNNNNVAFAEGFHSIVIYLHVCVNKITTLHWIKLYCYGLKQISDIYASSRNISNTFMFDLIAFAKNKPITLDMINVTIEFGFAVVQINNFMLTDLSLYEVTDPLELLGFVCLLSILQRPELDLAHKLEQYRTKKQKTIYTLLVVADRCLASTTVQNMQKEVFISNLIYFFKQAIPIIHRDIMELHFALSNISIIIPKSKALVLLINQLPFDSYSEFVKRHVKLCHSHYNATHQNFCINLLGNPHIQGDMEIVDMHQQKFLTKKMIMAVLWSLQCGSMEIVCETTRCLIRILDIPDESIINIVKEGLKDDRFRSLKIMDFLHQFCSIRWAANKKPVNKLYIKAVLKVYYRFPTITLTCLEQLADIVDGSDVDDLLDCLPDLVEVFKRYPGDKAISRAFCRTLAIHASAKHKSSPLYITALYHIIFDNYSDNRKPGLDILSMLCMTLNLETFIKGLVAQQHLKVDIFEANVRKIIDLKLFNLVVTMDKELKSIKFSPTIKNYWSTYVSDKFLHAHYALEFFPMMTNLVSQKNEFHPDDRNFFAKMLLFIRERLQNRKFPTKIIHNIMILSHHIESRLNIKDPWMETYISKLEYRTKDALIKFIERYGSLHHFPLHYRDLIYLADAYSVYANSGTIVPNAGTMKLFFHALRFVTERNCSEDYVAGIVKCCTKLCMRSEKLLLAVIEKLKQTLNSTSTITQINSLCSIYDLISVHTRDFESLMPFIFQFVGTNNHSLQRTGIHLLVRLVNNEHLVLNHWQIFIVLTYLTGNMRPENYGTICLDEQFFKKNEHIIVSSFVRIILYFNKCYNFSHYCLSDKEKSLISRHRASSANKNAAYSF